MLVGADQENWNQGIIQTLQDIAIRALASAYARVDKDGYTMKTSNKHALMASELASYRRNTKSRQQTDLQNLLSFYRAQSTSLSSQAGCNCIPNPRISNYKFHPKKAPTTKKLASVVKRAQSFVPFLVPFLSQDMSCGFCGQRQKLLKVGSS